MGAEKSVTDFFKVLLLLYSFRKLATLSHKSRFKQVQMV